MFVIVHPTDFTVDSERAFLLACSIARDQSAELIVVHVVADEDCSEELRNGDELDPDSLLFQSNWNRFKRLRSLAEDISMAFQVKIGQPVDAIVGVARHADCDLLVLAARYHDSLVYEIHSSVATCLVSRAHCPVLCLNEPVHYEWRHEFARLQSQVR